jgi:hypothetical protein
MPQRDLARHARRMRTRRIPLLALAALLTLPLLGMRPQVAEAAAPPLNWTYRDRAHQFSLKMFRDYKAVPLKPNEKTTVCKFRDPKSKGQARGTYDAEVSVVHYRPEGPVTTGDEAKPAEGPSALEDWREKLEEARRPKNIFDATIANLWIDEAEKKKLEEYKKDFQEIESKDKPKIPGRLWAFDVTIMGDETLHICLAEFVRGTDAFGIFMNCGGPLKKNYARSFVKIAKSFKWHDDKAKDVETLDVLDGVNITPKKRHEIERSMVSNWDVIVSPKKNYIVIYNTKNGDNHALAKTIAKRIELIREQVYEVQFPPAQPIDTVCVVRVCEDAKEYRAYGGPGGSAGYWSPGAEELVFYDASRSKKADKDTLAVLYHEAFHQYIHYSVGRVAPHSWFNEGHGDYYAGAEFKGGKFKIKPFQWRVGVIKSAIVEGERECTEDVDDDGKVRRQWGGKGYTPLKDLVGFSRGEYYSYPSVCYAQGWSLIYFLREIVPNNKKYEEKWGHILDLYFNTLKAEVNKDGSLDKEREERRRKAEEEAEKEEDGEGEGEKKDGDAPPPPAPGPSPSTPPAPRGGGTPPDDGGDDEGDDDATTNEAPRVLIEGLGGPGPLKKALEVAFQGVDWAEFQEAWLKATKRGK